MVVVIFVKLGVEEVQDRYLHHALVEVCSPVLHDLDSHHLLCFQILTLHHLSESTLTQHVQYQIPIFMRCLFAAEYVIHIEDIVGVVVVVTVVLHTFAGFGENSTRVPRRLILKVWVTYPVC